MSLWTLWAKRDTVTEGPLKAHAGVTAVFVHPSALCHEPTFRLNAGNCERHTQDRLDDLFRAMAGKTITCKELTS